MEFKNVQDFEVFFSKYDVTLAQQIKNENQNYEISDEDSFNSNKGFDFYQEIRALLNQDQKKSIRTRHISLHKIGEAVNKALACYPNIENVVQGVTEVVGSATTTQTETRDSGYYLLRLDNAI
jgi:hypothetical protein